MSQAQRVHISQHLRLVKIGQDMADDLNDRFHDRDDNDRTIAAAFFLSWSVLNHTTEKAFMEAAGLSWVLSPTGQKQLTYTPPIEGTFAVTEKGN